MQDLSKERGKTILISSHILSEIDLLADDIGIIHEGNLLEESSMDELRKKNQKYVLFRVSSTVTAARILEQKCGGVNYLIEDDNVIRVYDTDIDLSRTSQYHQLCWWFAITPPGSFVFPPKGGLTNRSFLLLVTA